ncbi:multiubiquitin domain-containing protein [Marinobacter nauticus]|jgi:hypothetical protein|uniref:multiubiquitin domain-containing protein n=1 Tax=Marinobacter nauticus TaxID=2743 RepID=UPI001A14202A|nr:multiubiquitin domain-containing protein [Marinobacter nauticus]HIO03805.1 hypothetical protein [Alphaproteobacteria bacterium]
MKSGNEKNDGKPELFIDNERFDWDSESITGEQLRELGAIPDDVDVFWKRPGQPDQEVQRDSEINLAAHPAPERFFTQAVGSQAG